MISIASVVINGCTRDFDKEYHYSIPGELLGRVKPGMRVIVPFGGSDSLKEAYVLGLTDSSSLNSLKKIKKVVDDNPVLNEKMLSLASWMRDRYVCTYSDAIKCMLPAGIGVKSIRTVVLVKYDTEHLKDKDVKILETLVECGAESEYNELKNRCGDKDFSKRIKKLEQLGLINLLDEYVTRVKEKTVRVAYLAVPSEEAVDEIESGRVKKIQQIRVLEMLMENEYVGVSDLARFAGVSPGVLDTLRKHGFIGFRDVEVKRDPLKHKKVERTLPLEPTLQQEKVLKEVKGMLDTKAFGEVLLHGVTGSGKTEVYLQLIQHAVNAGRRAIVLVPEISLTPQMVDRFKGRFGDDVAVLHSRLSPGERYDQWRTIREGRIKVVVGARSAVFAPLEDLGIVIIDEEHENSYKSEITPKYHASDVARVRCINENAVLLYGSATPSIDTYFKALNADMGFHEMSERANSMLMPEVRIVDMRKELDDGNRSIFSTILKDEIEKNIELGQQTILFLNRRGYASFVLCRGCGYTMRCANCNISLTYHNSDERLICHYCGYTVRMPKLCPKCGSVYIRQFGTGTQRVEEEIKKQFPGCSVIRMDMDTTNFKNSHEEILRVFRDDNVNIMVGTQMIAKGHDFPNVTLVGVMAADSMLNVEDYRASERTFQLVTQVAGRAGRGDIPGRVVIQTYNTEDFSILAACKHDYKAFYRQEIGIREKLGYPPFTNIGLVVLSGVDDRSVFREAKLVRDSIAGFFNIDPVDADIFGPTRSPLSKIKNRYRWRIIIKCRAMDKLINVLTEATDAFRRKKGINGVDLSMDVNPASML